MMWQSRVIGLGAAVLLAILSACNEKTPSSVPAATASGKDRPAAKREKADPDQGVPMGQLMAAAKREHGPQAGTDMPPGYPPTGATMPAGHPAVGTSLPAGHPPIGKDGGMSGMGMGETPAEPQHPEHMLQFNPPATWIKRPARQMTVAVYALPKAPADPTDAQLTISHYPEMKDISFQQQVDRWAGMFEQADTQAAGPAIKQYKLDNAAHPTMIADISGPARGSTATAAGDRDYRLMAAVVETDDGPWFFKLVGPKATVSQHADEFSTFVREAK